MSDFILLKLKEKIKLISLGPSKSNVSSLEPTKGYIFITSVCSYKIYKDIYEYHQSSSYSPPN